MPEIVQVLPLDEHNRRLLSHVHPSDWVNPRPQGRYNLVVVGAGTAGLVAASAAAGLGARVALVERALLGGDCLNVGCVPSKALLRCARAAADVRDAAAYGVRGAEGATVDFAAVMERMRRLRASIGPNDSAERYRGLGVDVYFGEARFTGSDALEVAGQTLRFRRAIVATGARAAVPDIPGLAAAGYYTNETIFTLTELPRRLAAIGAGPIGCELAQAFARLGAEVTLLESASQILPKEDLDAARIVECSLARDGVRILLGSCLRRIESSSDGRLLSIERGDKTESLAVDAILMAVGRQPNVEGLGLEAAGVEFNPRDGIAVDDRLRTGNRRIFAAGDVASHDKFTHAADALARIAIQNALFFGRARASGLVVPRCTYTDPEIAHVGLGEHDARDRGIEVDTFTQELGHVDRAILDGETEGFVRVHVRRGTDRIVGGTIVARHAGETIGELTLAIVERRGLKTLARTIHPYPTQAEGIKRTADAYNRTRLKPWAKSLLEKWFAWGR